MSVILVVDDSAVDRRLVGGLLERDVDLEVHYAADGSEAMLQLERVLPDLIVSDLLMPQIDGLALVGLVRTRYPLVPVILITSRGSEAAAIQALQAGAASYVHKQSLAHDLLDTIHRVLAVSYRPRSHTRLIGRMTQSESRFVLENNASLFRPLVTYLQESVTYLGICGDMDRTRLGVALEEVLANALYHGNLGLGSHLRQEDDAAYYAEVKARRNQSPYRDRRIYVQARLEPRQAAFVVRDEGEGFDPSLIPDPTDPANLEKVTGRGIFLMRTFMDEVVYNEVGNEVTLVKRGG